MAGVGQVVGGDAEYQEGRDDDRDLGHPDLIGQHATAGGSDGCEQHQQQQYRRSAEQQEELDLADHLLLPIGLMLAVATASSASAR